MVLLKHKVGPAECNSEAPICPLLQQVCIRGNCVAWQKLVGRDPQTGKSIDTWGCSEFRWRTVLQIDQTKQQNSVAAATESLRNELAHRMDNTNTVLANMSRILTQVIKQQQQIVTLSPVLTAIAAQQPALAAQPTSAVSLLQDDAACT